MTCVHFSALLRGSVQPVWFSFSLSRKMFCSYGPRKPSICLLSQTQICVCVINVSDSFNQWVNNFSIEQTLWTHFPQTCSVKWNKSTVHTSLKLCWSYSCAFMNPPTAFVQYLDYQISPNTTFVFRCRYYVLSLGQIIGPKGTFLHGNILTSIHFMAGNNWIWTCFTACLGL